MEINAVAVIDRTGRTPVKVRDSDAQLPYSPGVLTHDRLFISSLPGRDASGSIPADAASEVDAALDRFKAVIEAAGLSLAHVVFVNPYLTSLIPSGAMNERYAKRFEFGNTPARATISVSALPEGHIVFTGVAVRDLSKRKAIRPKNMRAASADVGSLQVLSHFGGEYDRDQDGRIRGVVWNRDGSRTPENYYADFVRGMADINYRGYVGFELCHPLPQTDGVTVGLEFADLNAQLAAEYMRGLIAGVEAEAVART